MSFLNEVKIALIKLNKAGFIAFMDLNSLKHTNDRYGHLAGDFAIARVHNLLRQHFTGLGHVVKFGGDEYVVVFKADSYLGASKIISEVQEQIRTDQALKDKCGGTSISVGLVKYSSTVPLEDLVNKADKLLSHAKSMPPAFLVTAEDPVDEDRRGSSELNSINRAYFSWITTQVYKENPQIEFENIVDATRKIWNDSLNPSEIAPNTLVSLVLAKVSGNAHYYG